MAGREAPILPTPLARISWDDLSGCVPTPPVCSVPLQQQAKVYREIVIELLIRSEPYSYYRLDTPAGLNHHLPREGTPSWTSVGGCGAWALKNTRWPVEIGEEAIELLETRGYLQSRTPASMGLAIHGAAIGFGPGRGLVPARRPSLRPFPHTAPAGVPRKAAVHLRME